MCTNFVTIKLHWGNDKRTAGYIKAKEDDFPEEEIPKGKI
jgi:hypothetical protein